MKRLLLILLVGAVSLLTVPFASCTAPVDPIPEPAEFEVSDLTISPEEAKPRQTVTVRVEVRNVGQSRGTHELKLIVDGWVRQSKSVTLDGGQAAFLSFYVQMDVVGSYTVELGGLTGVFRVVPEPTPVASISGRVVDFATRQPVGNTVVNIGDQSATTDSSGNYALADVPVGLQAIEVRAEGYLDYANMIDIEIGSPILEDVLIEPAVIQESVSGLLMTYGLRLEGDASNSLKMRLHVRNIESDSLSMIINGALVDDFRNVYDLFELVSNVSVTNLQGEMLPVTFSETTVIPDNWYGWFRRQAIYYDVLRIDTKGNSELMIEYDVISSVDMWLALQADSSFPWDHPRDFWAGYLEWLLFRPQGHVDVCSAKLVIELPEGWRFAAVYPNLGHEVDLGKMDYMYGDNEVRWKNFQKGNFVLFREGPFRLASRIINDTKVQDVYSAHWEGRRNPEAGFQYYEYFCDNLGPLPVHATLTFLTWLRPLRTLPDPSVPFIDYQRIHQAGPYGWAYSLMGVFHSAGGDIGSMGISLPQVQVWDFDSLDDNASSFLRHHGLLRCWFSQLIQVDAVADGWLRGGLTVYYENLSASSRYGWDQIIERRFKPMYQYYLDNIAGPPETDRVNSRNASFVLYFKSALAFLYIDETLKEHSGGTKELSDAVSLLYEEALAGRAVSRQSLIIALNSLTDYDFTQVVDDYIYGDKKLNLDRWLK